jgi:hypothetical protein
VPSDELSRVIVRRRDQIVGDDRADIEPRASCAFSSESAFADRGNRGHDG